MKSFSRAVFLTAVAFAFGCETPTEKNLVDGTVRKRDGGYQPRPQEDRLPHERRLDEQIYHPRKAD